MNPGRDGIVREAWRTGDLGDEPGASGSAHYGKAPKPEPVMSVAARAGEWERRFRDLVDDADEGEEPDDGALAIEGLAALQHATDKALARLERQLVDRLTNEVVELAARIAGLEAARRADEERHRVAVAGLCADLASQRKLAVSEVEQQRAENLLLHNELAEVRAVDRLRSSRAGRSHEARVKLKLARKELQRQAQESVQ
jgi:hypothetical protein